MKTKLLLIAALVSYGLWQFWPLLHAGFVYEDYQALPYTTLNWPPGWVNNHAYWQYLNRYVLMAWVEPIFPGRFWAVLTLWINFKIGGMNPVGYHVANLLIHAANVCLVFALGRLIWKDSFGLPLAAAAIFGLHGLQIETVAYVVARAELMATFFVLLSFYMLLTDHRWLTVLFALFAGASKESFVVVWVLLAGIAAARYLTRWGWTVVMLGLATSGVLGIGFVSTRAIWPSFAAPTDGWHYAGVQIAASVRYLALFFWPRGLTVDHDFDGIGAAAILASCALIMALFLWAWRVRERTPELLIGLVWMAIAIGPRLILRTPEYLNEHQLYLPMLGMTLACCGVLRAWLDTEPREDLRCLLGL